MPRSRADGRRCPVAVVVNYAARHKERLSNRGGGRASRLAFAIAVLVAAPLLRGGQAHAVTLRYQANQVGDFVLIGNTLAQDCGSQTPNPTVGTVGACGMQSSDTSPDVFWRAADSGGATADTTITPATARSTAILSVPTG